MHDFFDESIFIGNFPYSGDITISNVADEYICKLFNITYNNKDPKYLLNPIYNSESMSNIWTIGKRSFMIDRVRIKSFPINVINNSTKVTPVTLSQYVPGETYDFGNLDALATAIMIKWYATQDRITITDNLYRKIKEFLPELQFKFEANLNYLKYDEYGILDFKDVLIDSKNKIIETNYSSKEFYLT